MTSVHPEFQGIRDTTHCWPFEFTDIIDPSAYEMGRNQDNIACVNDASSFVEAREVFKKYRMYHCAPFEHATLIILVHFVIINIEVDPLSQGVHRHARRGQRSN